MNILSYGVLLALLNPTSDSFASREEARSYVANVVVQLENADEKDFKRTAEPILVKLNQRVDALRNEQLQLLKAVTQAKEREEILARFRPIEEGIYSDSAVLFHSEPDKLVVLAALKKSSPARRLQILKQLAARARKDYDLKPDEVYFGPSCGSYDHSDEYILQWAIARYESEAMSLLQFPKWDGRAYFLRSLITHLAKAPDSEAKLESLRPLVFLLTTDKSAIVRGEAIRSLKVYPGPDSEEVILTALASKHDDTVAKAAEAAGELKLKSALPKLEVLIGHPRWDVPRCAVEALIAIDKGNAATILFRRLDMTSTSNSIVLQGLVETGDRTVPLKLLDLYKNPKTANRDMLFDRIVDLDQIDEEELILTALQKETGPVLKEAMSQAGYIKLKSALPYLRNLVTSKDEETREDARYAIISILEEEGDSLKTGPSIL